MVWTQKLLIDCIPKLASWFSHQVPCCIQLSSAPLKAEAAYLLNWWLLRYTPGTALTFAWIMTRNLIVQIRWWSGTRIPVSGGRRLAGAMNQRSGFVLRMKLKRRDQSSCFWCPEFWLEASELLYRTCVLHYCRSSDYRMCIQEFLSFEILETDSWTHSVFKEQPSSCLKIPACKCTKYTQSSIIELPVPSFLLPMKHARLHFCPDW